MFNGYVNQYKFPPIRVEPNQRVRVWVMDDGPSENSSFHVIGTIFDTTFKEGEYLLQPGPSHGGDQRHSTCSRRKGASSSSPSTSLACIPSSRTSSRPRRRGPWDCSKPVM